MRSNSSPPVTLGEVGAQLTQAPQPPLTSQPTVPSLPLPSSQLHGQVEVGRALVNVLQSHNVGVADSAKVRRNPHGLPQPSLGLSGWRGTLSQATEKRSSVSSSSCLCPLPHHRLPCGAQQGRTPGLPGNTADIGTPPQDLRPQARRSWLPGQSQVYLRSTAISFSTRASLPPRAFLGMHLRATRREEPRSWASTTSEKAPLPEVGQCKKGGSKVQRGRKGGRGRESRGVGESPSGQRRWQVLPVPHHASPHTHIHSPTRIH